MLIRLAILDPDLEKLVRDALERLGFASAPSEESQHAGAAALIADERHPAAQQADPTLALILLGSATEPQATAGAAGARRVWLRKPFTQRALANALRAVHPNRVPRPLPPLAIDDSMKRIASRLEALAATPLTLVLSGEAGTGKTHWARWLHARSARAAGPLVEVSLGALHRAGGSDLLCCDGREPGPLEASHGGTLLVEELPELSRTDQLALLRFLIERSDARGAPVDARVIVTTRRGLVQEAAAGRLHPDLAARLRAAEIALPPLRERPGDLRQFAWLLAERCARAANGAASALDEGMLAVLERQALPGNLHELQNRIERWTLLGRDAGVEGGSRAGASAAASAPGEALNLRELERRAIARALELNRGNRVAAARALGIHARTLRNKLRARGSEPA